MKIHAPAVVLLALAWPASSSAQSATEKTPVVGAAEVFGKKGQVVVSSDVALTVARSTTSGVSGGTTTVDLQPAIDFFALSNLSLGGFVGFGYTTAGDNHATRLAVGPRIGYNLGLSDLVSLWPKVGFSYAHTSTTASTPTSALPTGTVTTTETTTTSNALRLNLFAPIVFHPAVHFFAGLGPFLDTDLSGDAKTTVWGVRVALGGWL